MDSAASKTVLRWHVVDASSSFCGTSASGAPLPSFEEVAARVRSSVRDSETAEAALQALYKALLNRVPQMVGITPSAAIFIFGEL
jgi:hypothetical protein